MSNNINFNTTVTHPCILVAPLEWGLGHATRCIPLINELLALDAKVLIAAEGATHFLLKKEFPQLTFLPLAGYRIKYSRNKKNLPYVLFFQIPKVLISIIREYNWLNKIVRTYQIDGVISDNRFGLFNRKVHTVYITHQLSTKVANQFTQNIARKIHYAFIKKYSECWVPDAQEWGLAGELSHPKILPKHTTYIGPLSRFFEKKVSGMIYDLLITISGPEPQRTIFQNLILKDLKLFKGKVLLVLGLPGVQALPVSHFSNVEFRNHLDAREMNEVMLQSKMILSRSGYTTIMDLVKLKKKAILVPTPGQSEQEYLADYLFEKNMFYAMRQDVFSLSKAISEALVFPFNIPQYDMELYKISLKQLIENVRDKRI